MHGIGAVMPQCFTWVGSACVCLWTFIKSWYFPISLLHSSIEFLFTIGVSSSVLLTPLSSFLSYNGCDRLDRPIPGSAGRASIHDSLLLHKE